MPAETGNLSDQAQLHANIKRSVAVSALKKLRHLVAQEEASHKLERRATVLAIIVFAVVFALAASIFASHLWPKARAKGQQPRSAAVGSQIDDPRIALYVHGLLSRLEKLGTEDFPKDGTGRSLYGVVTATVTVGSDGALKKVVVVRSSGHKELDVAVEMLVQRGAPYSPFPASLAGDFDVLEITRSFSFTNTDAGSK